MATPPACPHCGNKMADDNPRYYRCTGCPWKVWKSILDKPITKEIVEELCAQHTTQVMDGFISQKNKKPFRAALTVTPEGTRLVFQDESIGAKSDRPEINPTPEGYISVRLESPSPGLVNIDINDPFQFHATVPYGRNSTRVCEAMGMIIVGRYMHHMNRTDNLYIRANSKEFAEYATGEITPRDKSVRLLIAYMVDALKPLLWVVKHEKHQNIRIKGGTLVGQYPLGIFPWLDHSIHPRGNMIAIRLPNYPEVCEQFMASFNTARYVDDELLVPEYLQTEVQNWFRSVRGDVLLTGNNPTSE